MPHLFAVMLGGRADGCHIELHDIVFVAGERITDTYPLLVDKWFGNKKRLHIDAYAKLDVIDGHQILLQHERPAADDAPKVYCVNFGGYRENFFGEIHEVAFYVAKSKNEALQRAKQQLCVGMSEQHCDDNLLVDDIHEVNSVDSYHIHCIPTNEPEQLEVVAEYHKFNTPSDAVT